MQQFQVNKYIRMALSLLVVIIAWAAGFDWTTIVSAATAAKIVGVIGVIKFAYAAFAPAADKSTAPTGGVIVTQKATS